VIEFNNIKIFLLKKGSTFSSIFISNQVKFDRNMLVSTQEIVDTIRQIQKVSNESTDVQVWDIIHQFDHNKDGFIDAEEILKVEKKIFN
jgi:hypothetical protein